MLKATWRLQPLLQVLLLQRRRSLVLLLHRLRPLVLRLQPLDTTVTTHGGRSGVVNRNLLRRLKFLSRLQPRSAQSLLRMRLVPGLPTRWY